MCGGGPPPVTSCDSTALTTPPVSWPWMRMTIGIPRTFIFRPPSDGTWIGFINIGPDVLPSSAGWQDGIRPPRRPTIPSADALKFWYSRVNSAKMNTELLTSFQTWAARLLQQVSGVNPFDGDCLPTRVSLFGFGRPTLPFPHLWNYKEPIKIFETFYWGADKETGSGKHNRYLYVAGLPPVLLTREPAIIMAVLSATGDKPGQFDRDTSPTAGIARATGEDSLLYANGPTWRRQKPLSAAPFSRSNLFQPEKFHGFEQTFRKTVAERLEALRSRQRASGKKMIRIELDPEIDVVMLDMLVNSFFGGGVSYEETRPPKKLFTSISSI